MPAKKVSSGGGDEKQELTMYYSNAIRIRHSLFEFLMDFAMAIPEKEGEAAVQARVIVSPQHMKALFYEIGSNLKKYEEQYGQLLMPGDKPDIDAFLDDVMGGDDK